MDPIIRAAALTPVRRPLRRPGMAPAAPVDAHGDIAAVAPVAPVAPAEPEARQPTLEELARAAEETLARARATLADAERQRAAWEAEQAGERARIEAADADLQRRELALAAARQAYDKAAAEGHADAAARGHEEGLARGTAEGRAGADAAVAKRLAQLDALARAMGEAADAALAAQEEMLVDVAWTAICRLAGDLATTRDGALAMVRAAVAQLRDGRELVVHVHPDDAAWLQPRVAAAAGWTLRADPAIALGGCIVEGNHGTLDARLELQLERLRDALRTARAARAGREHG